MSFRKRQGPRSGVLTLILLGTAWTASPFAAAAPAGADESMDARFAVEAAYGGMAEVRLGQLAQKNSGSQAVKDFAQKMVSDHSKANEELKGIASREKIALPADLSKADLGTYKKLSKLKGAEFDKAYASLMVKDHEKDVAEFERQATRGENPSLKEFARDTLPTLHEHLQQAGALEKMVSSGT